MISYTILVHQEEFIWPKYRYFYTRRSKRRRGKFDVKLQIRYKTRHVQPHISFLALRSCLYRVVVSDENEVLQDPHLLVESALLGKFLIFSLSTCDHADDFNILRCGDQVAEEKWQLFNLLSKT